MIQIKLSILSVELQDQLGMGVEQDPGRDRVKQTSKSRNTFHQNTFKRFLGPSMWCMKYLCP